MLPEKLAEKLMIFVSVFALIFVIIGLAAPIFTLSKGGSDTSINLFHYKSCYNSDCTTYSWGDVKDCSKVVSKAHAAAAFLIIALLLLIGCAALAVLEHLEKFSKMPVSLGVFAAASFTLMLTWCIEAAAYGSKCDNMAKSFKDSEYKYGGGFVCALIGWLVFTGSIVGYVILKRRGAGYSSMEA